MIDIWNRLARGLCPAFLMAIAGCCPAPENELNGRAKEIVRGLVRLSDPFQDPVDPEERIRKSTYSSYGLGFLDEPKWLFRVSPEEAELIAIGPAASGPVLDALASPKSDRTLRVRFAQLAAQLGDRNLGPALGGVARSESDPLVRLCLIQSMARLDPRYAAAFVQDSKEKEQIIRQVQWWCSAMSGDADSKSRYFDFIDAVLASEELEKVTDGPTSTLTPNPSGKHLYVRAKKPDMLGGHDLYLEVWRLAQLRDTRTVDRLIRSLAFHDLPTQHVAIHFLCRDVGIPADLSSWTEYELHSLTIYRRWNEWWNENKDSLRWVESSLKYMRK